MFNDQIITDAPEGAFGFVYEITHKTTGRKYIGQKRLWIQVTKPPLKGKTRKRRSKKESDWQSYYGSNDQLKTEVVEQGGDAFDRKIIHLCASKAEMNYKETKEIFLRDAILRDDYYNQWVCCKVSRNQFPK